METKNFKCKEGCSACCGIVPIPTNIWNKNKNKINKFVEHIHASESFVLPVTEDLKCCFLKDNKCLIYKDRPDVCKKYGITDELPCPYLKPNGNAWSEGKAKQIRKKIDRTVDLAIKISGQQIEKTKVKDIFGKLKFKRTTQEILDEDGGITNEKD